MTRIETPDEAISMAKNCTMALLMFSTSSCAVCAGLKPKIEAMLGDYPCIKAGYVDLDKLRILSGEFSIFTVPTVLVYAEGAEMIRMTRFVSLSDLSSRISRFYGMLST